MKKTAKLLLLLSAILITSCSKDDDPKCGDQNAWNYGSGGNCQFTKVIFYAPSNQIGGIGQKIVKIEVFRGSIDLGVLIGTITDLPDATPAPVGCQPSANSIEYQFQGKVEDELFRTRNYFEDGVNSPGESYHFSTSSNECITQKLTI